MWANLGYYFLRKKNPENYLKHESILAWQQRRLNQSVDFENNTMTSDAHQKIVMKLLEKERSCYKRIPGLRSAVIETVPFVVHISIWILQQVELLHLACKLVQFALPGRTW